MRLGDVTYFEWFAPLYDLFMPSATSESLQAGLDRADREVQHVLDVGGGTGRGVRAVTAEKRLVVDAAHRMLKRARGHGLAAVRANGAQLPVRTETVDGVLVVDALHHIRDQHAVLEEAHRVLRPGGVLVVSDFDPTTVRGRGLVFGERLVGFDPTFHPPESLAETMAGVDFEVTITDSGFGYTVAGVK